MQQFIQAIITSIPAGIAIGMILRERKIRKKQAGHLALLEERLLDVKKSLSGAKLEVREGSNVYVFSVQEPKRNPTDIPKYYCLFRRPEKSQITIQMNPLLFHLIKSQAIENKQSMYALINDALRDYFLAKYPDLTILKAKEKDEGIIPISINFGEEK